jgi:hypothetical protein
MVHTVSKSTITCALKFECFVSILVPNMYIISRIFIYTIFCSRHSWSYTFNSSPLKFIWLYFTSWRCFVITKCHPYGITGTTIKYSFKIKMRTTSIRAYRIFDCLTLCANTCNVETGEICTRVTSFHSYNIHFTR